MSENSFVQIGYRPMGLSIGQLSSGTSALRAASEARRAELGQATRRPLGILQQQEEDGRGPFFRRDARPVSGVGFGEGTLSGPGAALDVLDRTIRGVRQLTPSLSEVSAQFRLRASEARVEARRASRNSGQFAFGLRRSEAGGALAAANARDEDESTALARTRGDENERPLGVAVESRIPEPSPLAQNFQDALVELRRTSAQRTEDTAEVREARRSEARRNNEEVRNNSRDEDRNAQPSRIDVRA